MWVRKTLADLKADADRLESRLHMRFLVASPFLVLVVYFSLLNPFALIVFLCLFCFLAALLSQYGMLFQGPPPDIFCPNCKFAQVPSQGCSTCGSPLEPITKWKWLEEKPENSETSPPLENSPSAHGEDGSTPSCPPEPVSRPRKKMPRIQTRYPGNSPQICRLVPISLPIRVAHLAAKIGIKQFQLIKDLMDENLTAAVNPRISDRRALTTLGRKYRIAFLLVS